MSEGAWWDAFSTAGGIDQLLTWLGGVDADSRVRIRQRIAECGYSSVVDVGAGLGIDYIGMNNLSHDCTYIGVEPSAKLREAAGKVAATFELATPIPLVEGTIQALPFEDSSHDLVYARHIFEHLPRVDDALAEMIRVARLEVIVVFFMRPGAETYLTRERDGLWQNRWSKSQIEQYVWTSDKVEAFFWEGLHNEMLLHIYLKDSRELDFGLIGQRLPQEDDDA